MRGERPSHRKRIQPTLVGRHALLDELDDAWRAARDGGGGVIVLTGDPAVGTSSLMEALARTVGEAHSVMVRGQGGPVPPLGGAAELASALLQLVEPDGSPAPFDEVEPVAASKLLGELFDRVDDTRAATVLIDDLHEVDPASLVALNLALRRLRTNRVLVVLGGRSTAAVRSFSEGFRLIEVPPLPPADATELLQSAAAVPVAPAVVEQLLDHAGGNPLALRELPSLLEPSQLRGEAPLPDPMPMVGMLRDAFTRPLAGLEPAARELLELASVSIDTSWAPLCDAAGGPCDTALDDLEAAGLGRLEHGRLVLSHPLLRSATIASMSDSRRRELHRRFASVELLGDEVRVQHRAAASTGPDEHLADELVELASSLRDRGASERAAELYDAATVLTGDDERRQELRLAAADVLALAGWAEPARRRLDAASDDRLGDRWRVPIELRRSWIEALNGDPFGAWQRLQDCLVGADATARGQVHAATSVPLGMLGLVPEIETQASLAIEATAPESAERQVSLVVLGHARRSLDESTGVADALDAAESLDLDAALEVDPLIGLHAGRLLAMAERHDAAEVALVELRSRARRRGSRVSLAMSTGALGEVWVRCCRFDAALAMLDEAVAVSMATGQRAFAPFWLALRARVRSLHGRFDDAARDLSDGFALAEELVLPGARYFLLAAAGLDALARDDPQGAVGHLEECRFFEEAGAELSPNVGRWRPDLVEAYCALGDVDAARRVLEPLSAAAATGDTRWTRASAVRAAALVDGESDPSAAVPRLVEAATSFHADVDRFDRARSLLDAVRLHHRAGGNGAAVRELGTEARLVFRSLRASPWEAKVDTSADAAAPSVGEGSLTPTEFAVLEQLSRGSTNVQIARALGISSKTVSNHLWKAYRKLGVANRTEAVHWFLTR